MKRDLIHTQVRSVFYAIRDGCRTSEEASAVTGLGVHTTSSCLHVLETRGKVTRLPFKVKFRKYSRGNIVWKVA